MRTVKLVEPPEAFGRVLRRTDRDLRNAHMQRVPGYDYTARGMAIEHPDGVQATTIFFPEGKDAAADRATKIGWIDCTALWKNGPLPEPPEKIEDEPPPLEPTAEMLKEMTWPQIQALAKERGTRQTGSRDMVERGIIESFAE